MAGLLIIRGLFFSGGCFWAGRHTRRCLPPISRVRTKHRNLDPRARLVALSIPPLKDFDGLTRALHAISQTLPCKARWSIDRRRLASVGDGRVGVASGRINDHAICQYGPASTTHALLLMPEVGRFEIFSTLTISLLHRYTFFCVCARVCSCLPIFHPSHCHPMFQEGLSCLSHVKIARRKIPCHRVSQCRRGHPSKVSPVCKRATSTACETGSGGRRSVGCLLYEAPPPGGLLVCCRPPERLCVVVCV